MTPQREEWAEKEAERINEDTFVEIMFLEDFSKRKNHSTYQFNCVICTPLIEQAISAALLRAHRRGFNDGIEEAAKKSEEYETAMVLTYDNLELGLEKIVAIRKKHRKEIADAIRRLASND